MIRINLLPVRAIKKKETAKQQISILILSLIVLLAIAAGAFVYLQTKIMSTKKGIESSEKELKDLKTKIGEIDNIKKLQDEVQKKLNILNQLRKDKSGPATRLAKLSEATPDKLWLTKYAENGLKVSLGGVAYNEDLIAEYMRNLLATGHFGNVELVESAQLEIGGVKAKRFEITCNIKTGRPDEPQPPAKTAAPAPPPGK
jgi:type IV pilus assembly protein PilN